MFRTFRRLLATAALLLLAFDAGDAMGAPIYGYIIVARYPHSTDSYTEGFLYLDGLFYEGTGLEGHSTVSVIYPLTGLPVRTYTVAPELFGEGIVDVGPYLYEWTWQTHTGVVLDRATLQPVRTFSYEGEGWGMTRNDHELITSDGTATLRFRDPATFRQTHSLTVTDRKHPITELNELEWVHGEIYANVWHSDRIARISPKDGHVIAWIDLSGLFPAEERPNHEAVLNGIAYDSDHDRLFVTGKQWPAVFEIKLTPKRIR